MSVTFTLNGKATTLDADPDMPLLWAIREVAGLHGTKYGCGIAQCGACTVHVDGQATRSCITPLSAVEGQHITTIEGITSKAGKTVQTAWVALQVPQCGYCQSGQIMSATALLEHNPKRCRYRRRHARQHLPLCDLSSNSRRDPRGRARDGGLSHG